MLTFLLIFFAAWIVLGAGLILGKVDQPRGPITPGMALVTVAVGILFAATLIWAAFSV